MPMHYFHLCDVGCVVRDLDGRDMAGPAAVVAAALAEARSIVGADALLGRIDLRQNIEVEDPEGQIVHRLRFSDAVEVVG